MNEITQNIETLLARHDYVIVPDFGGFVLRQESAVVSDEKMLPPYQNVSFNPLMKGSDGLLAIEVSRTQDISYRQAVHFILLEVEKYKNHLSEQKTLEFGRLGCFAIDDQDKMVFSPNVDLGFLPNNYGIKELYTPMLRKRELGGGRQTVTIKLPTRRTFLKYASISLLAIGLAFAAPKVNSHYQMQGSFNFVEKMQDLFRSASVLPEQVELPPLTLPQSNEKVLRESEQEIFFNKVSTSRYYVVVSSLKNRVEAERIKKAYRTNFEDTEVLTNGNLCRVCVKSFDNYTDAHTFTGNLRRKYRHFKDAWVYKQ